MQIGTMIASMMGPQTTLSLADSPSKTDAENLFQSLLNKSGNEQLGEELESMLKDMSSEELIAFIMQQLDEGMSLNDVLEKLSDTSSTLEEDYPEIMELLNTDEQSLCDVKVALEDLLVSLNESTEEVANQPMTTAHLVVNEVGSKDIKQEVQSILKTVSELLEKYQDKGKLNKADAAKLTTMLKQWSSLMHQAKGADINVEKLQEQMLAEDEGKLWNKLMDRFEKRTYYTGKNIYTQNANVSKQDVMNWLQQAAENQKQPISNSATSASHEQQASISKLEQYVIHLENSGKVERIGNNLVEKFAEVIRNSQFLNRSSGKMELNLIIKPAHLGNITVKMTQVDGDMMVKMLVSSQAAKDMLEQNIHQLRHLFQPHQVSVERNEAVTDEEFYFDQDDQEDKEGQQSTEENHENDDQSEDNQEINFEAIMDQLREEVVL